MVSSSFSFSRPLIAFLLQSCILLSFIGVHHAFVTPTSTFLGIGQNHILTLTAVKKSFDRNQNNIINSGGETTVNTKRGGGGLLFRLRIIRRNRKQRQSTATSAAATAAAVGPATTYIPSGMSLDEYNSIKKAEQLEASTKNYGAWGPRFAQTSRPDGDWMVLPQLWTLGAAVDSPIMNGNADGSNGDGVPRTPLQQQIRQQVPAMILATVLFDSILTAITMYKAATVDWRQMLMIAFRLPIFLFQNITKNNWKQVALIQLSIQFSKMHAVKALLVLVTAPFLDHYVLNPINRYRLWSKRRTVTVSTLGSMGVLGLWAVVLGTLKRVGIL